MCLKSLELQGFKSFADKVKMEFGPGITAIVGPNGSGKSNISDAVRWVLGEQSAKSLRGSKMEDIIFAGSSKRKAVGMAEVSLTLDNSSGIFPLPYAEIAITRRAFRSGEGEYLINKNICRLKDVQELFNDTGLGKDSFAIIGQGQVEEILNSRPEERRALIEEAAGIIKYRNRKREAFKKLEETEKSLVRIVDIIYELSQNLEPLGLQAQKAEQFKQLKSELDALEINLAIRDLEKTLAEIAGTTQIIQQNSLRIQHLEATYQTTEAKLEMNRFELNQLDEEISSFQQQLFRLTEELNKYDNTANVAEERLKVTTDQMQSLQREVEQYQDKRDKLQRKFKNQASMHQTLKRQVTLKQDEIKQIEERLATADQAFSEAEQFLEGLKNQIIDCLQQIATTRNNLNKTIFEQNALEQKMSRNRERTLELGNKLSLLKSEQQLLGKEIAARNLHVKKNLEEQTKLAGEKEEHELQLQKYQLKISETQKELQTLLSRQQVMLEMQKEYEGYFQGVKSVLQARAEGNKVLPGICGAVGELIAVPAEYEKAIEVTLGSSLQNIVVKTAQDAEAAIEYLKRHRLGRATFLPLNSIQPRELSEEAKRLLNKPGVVGLAAELIGSPAQYAGVVRHLLGNILVTRELKQALKLAREAKFSIRIVTLDGDIVNAGGSLTGGSLNKKNTGLLARPREIKELEQGIAKKHAEIEALSRSQHDVAKKIADLEAKLKLIAGAIQTEKFELVALEQKLQSKQQEVAELDKENGLLQVDYENYNSQLGDVKIEQQHLEALLAELESQNMNRDSEAKELQDHLKAQKGANKAANDQLTSLKVDLASLQQQEENLQSELSDYYAADREYESLISQKRHELEQRTLQKEQFSKTREECKAQLILLVQEKAKLGDLLENKLGVREGIKENISELEKEAKDKFKELNVNKEQMHSLEIQLARLESEHGSSLKRMEEKFQLTFSEALSQRSEVLQIPDAQNRVKRLRRELNTLGEVNLAAIEEYKKQKERFDFLSKQEADLKEAKAVLNKIIKEIDTVMINRFETTFYEINTAFSEVFRDLFNGGKARLDLTDPDNLLETGVEIIAQPPGKRLQNLSLLSGGERALTAIALLFAILKVKPSPFCVLDEIEASLDEVNVDRFALFLQMYSKNSQFIIISHRQGTMEVADNLYGVTMEESGVSKLLSVRLTEAPARTTQSA